MANDPLIDVLVDDLSPVRRRAPRRELTMLAGLALVEGAGFILLGMARPDLATAIAAPAFWWKAASLALLAVAGVRVAVRSFDPTFAPRAALRLWAIAAVLALLLGWPIDIATPDARPLADRVMWRMGIDCVVTMTVLSVPPMVALGLLMRNGAPTDRAATAWGVGAASACWGAAIFAVHCSSDDPFYIALWYPLGCGLVALLARVALPRVARW
ncbi:MAG: NrsF family protein [Pseudomonadota bacterium]